MYRSVLTGAQLLAEGLKDRGGFAVGYDWAAEQLRQAGLHRIAAEVSFIWIPSINIDSHHLMLTTTMLHVQCWLGFYIFNVRLIYSRIAVLQVVLAKASRHLALKEVDQATAVYKTFERQRPTLRAAAATNLSFLYLLEGDLAAAAKYTDLALKTDRCVQPAGKIPPSGNGSCLPFRPADIPIVSGGCCMKRV